MSFREDSAIIMEEISRCLSKVDDREAETIVNMILSSEKVFVVGVGRVLLMLQAFVKRLNHLGIDAYYVGQIDEEAITEKDLLIVASGSGESAVPVAITKVAQRFHPKVAYIGSNMNSTAAGFADGIMRLPCKTKLALPDELPSCQPLSSLFEQSLLLACDALCLMLIRRGNIDIDSLWGKHANLE